MRPAPGTAWDAYLRDVAAERAVKSGAGQDRAGCSRTGPPDNDALTDLEGRGARKSNDSADSGGRAPAPPKSENPTTSTDVRVSLKGNLYKRNTDTTAGQRPKRGCGATWTGPSRSDPGLWMMHWGPDDTMGCEHCGPRVRQEKADAYLARIGGAQLYARVVAGEGWATMARKLTRNGVDYWQCPMPDGRRLVLVNKGPGEPVADNRAAVLAAIAAYPVESKMKMSASRAWQPVVVAGDQGEQDQAEGYDFRYLVRAGLEHARQVATELGLYVGEVAGRDGVAFLYRKPDDSLTWHRFVRWAGLEDMRELGRRQAARRRKRVAA